MPVALATTADLAPERWGNVGLLLFVAVLLLIYPATLISRSGSPWGWMENSGGWGTMFLGLLFLTGAIKFLLIRREVRLEAVNGGEIAVVAGYLFAPTWKRVAVRQLTGVRLEEVRRGQRYRVTFEHGKEPLLLAEVDEHGHAMRVALRAAACMGLPVDERWLKKEGRVLAPAEVARLAAMLQAGVDVPWWKQPAALMLVAMNLAPLAGVAFFAWDLLAVMLAFWIDGVAIGLFGIPRIALARRHDIVPLTHDGYRSPAYLAAEFAAIFGTLTLFHGIFIVILFGVVAWYLADLRLPLTIQEWLAMLPGPELAVAGLAALLTRGYDFLTQYLLPRAYETADAEREVRAPYGRLILTYFVVMASGGMVMSLNAPVGALALLVVLKTAVDLLGYMKRYRARSL